jgi:dTDP-4-dehydrorhamnose 3,5-epimerase
MKFTKTELPDVYIIEPYTFADERGVFRKTYQDAFFKEGGIHISIEESFYTVSGKNVIRGMHFQMPPFDYCKVVYVTEGVIHDVILDLRRNSPTYAKYISVQLSSENGKQVYIPKGFAHGFAVLSDRATVTYLQTTVHSAEHDSGIRWNSFGMNWGIKDPILSDRDRNFPALQEFECPFLYKG